VSVSRILLVAIATLSLASHVAAQDTSTAAPDPRAEASAHFQRGTDLFNEGRYDAALAEFQRAYDIAPALPVLYNLARVHAELGHPVESAHAYERYLSEGGSTIAAARRAEVTAALAQQRDRVGRLRIETNVDGAFVSVDGRDVTTTPLTAPIELGSGTHVIGVHAPGYEAVSREVSIAGTVESAIAIELRREVEQRGTLRIAATLPGVTVRVDGHDVGTTPLGATLPVPVGDHEVSGVRAGYFGDGRTVHVDDGAEVEVTLRLTLDPDASASTRGQLALALPHATSIVHVDGETMTGSTQELPIGPHHVVVDVDDRAPWSGDVTIAPDAPLTLTPPLEWTADARASRISAAQTQFDAGLGLGIAGLAVMLVAVPVSIWNESQISGTDAAVIALNRELVAAGCAHMMGTATCVTLQDRGAGLQSQQDTENIIRYTSIAIGALGAIALATGLTFVLTSPSAQTIDASAHASLRIGPGGLMVDGRF
jgi:hypothetical protein